MLLINEYMVYFKIFEINIFYIMCEYLEKRLISVVIGVYRFLGKKKIEEELYLFYSCYIV